MILADREHSTAVRWRTPVETVFLKEMVELDRELLLDECSYLDDMVPENTVGQTGLFGNTSSGDILEDLDDIDDDEILDDEDIF